MPVSAEPDAQKRFEKSPGEPLLVHFHKSLPTAVLRDFRRTVKRGGGIIEDVEGEADVIVVGSDRSRVQLQQRYEHTPAINVVSQEWIHRSEKSKRGPGKVIYLTEEQQHLALYLAQRLPEIEQGGRSGRIVYRELVAPEAAHLYPWACYHSAEAWRMRYKNNKKAMDAEIERIVKLNPLFLKSKLRMRFSRINRHSGKVNFDVPDKEGSDEEASSGSDASEEERVDTHIEGQRNESPVDDGSSISSPIPGKGKGKARAVDMLTQHTDATLVNPTQRDTFSTPDRRDIMWTPTGQRGSDYRSTSQMGPPSTRSLAQPASPAPLWRDMHSVAGPSRQTIPARSFNQPAKASPAPSQRTRPQSPPQAAFSAPQRTIEDPEEETHEEIVDILDSDDEQIEKELTGAKRRFDGVEQEVFQLEIDDGVHTKRAQVDRQRSSVTPLISTLASPSHSPLQRQGIQAQATNRRKTYQGIQNAASPGSMRSLASFVPRSISQPESLRFIKSSRSSVDTHMPATSSSYNRLPARLQPFGGVGDPYARYDPPIAAMLRRFERKYEFVPREIIKQYEDTGQNSIETEEKLKRNRDTITSMDLDSDSSSPVSPASSEHFIPAPSTRAFKARQIMDARRS